MAFILSAVAIWATAQLPIHTSRQALLPQDTEVAQRFNRFLQKFGAASDLMVVLENAPREELQRFANELAAKLGNEPEIAQATARLDRDFFLQHGYLLLPPERLAQLESAVSKPPVQGGLEAQLKLALDWTQNPPPLAEMGTGLQAAAQGLRFADSFLAEWQRWLKAESAPAAVEWGGLLAQQGGAMAEGYFASRDGRMLFVFVHPQNPSEDFQNLGPFVDKVKAVAAELATQAKAAGRTPPKIGLTGLPAIEYEEYVNIRKDITLVVFTSAGLIAVLIFVVVRSVRWAALIFIPMGLGVLWSLGLALVTVGHLTLITAAFIAILFGLGADYGIFTSSRIAEERRTGKPLIEAIGAGIGSSFIAVLTAGGASLLIFSALTTVDFPGFAELGVVAAKGVLMILISTWLVQPALYVLLPPELSVIQKPLTPPSPGGRGLNQSGRFPLPVACVLVLLAVGGAVVGAQQGLKIPFNYDVLAMLPKDSEAAYYQKRMVAESDFQAEVVIFTAPNVAEARRIAEAASQFKTIAQVQSLAMLFPADADARLQTAHAIGAAAARDGLVQRLDAAQQAGLSVAAYQSLLALLKNGLDVIDEAQEQAFSAGHADLVKDMEAVRGRLAQLHQQLAADPERGRVRSEALLRALLTDAASGLGVLRDWRQAAALTPASVPPALRDRFFAADGSVAVYAFPAKSVYDPDNLDALMADVYKVSPNATGFPTTHQAFAKAVVKSFSEGTLLALAVCLVWILLALRSLRGFVLAALPLLIGGGWMLGLMAWAGIQYNYANIVALPLVIALAVDYGVWFSYRWRELRGYSPLQVTLTAGKVIGLAAGTELAGLGAITLASYRGVSSLGVSITLGLLCCLAATFFIAPAIGQLLDSNRKP